MPAWLAAAGAFISKGWDFAINWMTGYQKPEVTAAREERDDQKLIDKFNKEQAGGKIEDVRKDLSDDSPVD